MSNIWRKLHLQNISNLSCSDRLLNPSFYAGVNCWNLGHNKTVSTKMAVQIMLSVSDQDSEHVGQGVPRRPQRNCIFIIDADELEDPNDATCDDNGTWKVKKGAMSYYYKLCGGKLISISEADYQQSDEAFHFKGRSYWCGSLNAFSKTFWWAEDRRCPFVMLQYIFDGPEQAFEVNSHKGCSVQTTPYRRVFPSTMSSINRDL